MISPNRLPLLLSGPLLHPTPNLLEKLGSRGPKVLNEAGAARQVNGAGKDCCPWGTRPWVPEPPGCLEMRDEDLCCGKAEAVMSGLDGNCRSPRAGRKKNREIPQSLSLFFFLNHSWRSLVFVQHSITLFAALSFALISAPVSFSVFISHFAIRLEKHLFLIALLDKPWAQMQTSLYLYCNRGVCAGALCVLYCIVISLLCPLLCPLLTPFDWTFQTSQSGLRYLAHLLLPLLLVLSSSSLFLFPLLLFCASFLKVFFLDWSPCRWGWQVRQGYTQQRGERKRG